MENEFYILYLDNNGRHMSYVNSYRNAHINSILEAEKYWKDLFNPRCYGLTFIKATESRLEYDQWTK